jgi:hypothetical protein
MFPVLQWQRCNGRESLHQPAARWRQMVRAGEMVSTAYLVSVESLVVSSGARHLLANLAVALRSARSLSSVHRQTTFAQSLSHLGLASCRDNTWL